MQAIFTRTSLIGDDALVDDVEPVRVGPEGGACRVVHAVHQQAAGHVAERAELLGGGEAVGQGAAKGKTNSFGERLI